MKLDKVLEKLDNVVHNYDCIYNSDCPAHRDGEQSLIIYQDMGEINLYCQKGCTKDEICRAIGINPFELSEGKKHYEFMQRFKTLDEFQEQETNWLIKNWLPEGQITLLAADGGVGKTTLWCDLAAAVSCGKESILDGDCVLREPRKVLIFTTEDSISKKLKKKLRLAGANMSNIIAMDFSQYDYTNDSFPESISFASPELKAAITEIKPALCIFDPVQGFIPSDINMSSRNAMRNTLAPLIPIGEQFGTTFLIVCHSNKRKGASGRDRIADSADLWDISRSVLMAGYTQDKNVRYLSNEKNNYAPLSKTVLFKINRLGLAESVGTSDKRDRDFTAEAMKLCTETKAAPQRDNCREFILETLKACEDGKIKSSELKQLASDEGYNPTTLQRAKCELRENNTITVERDGGKNGVWYTKLSDTFTVLPQWEVTPFELSP